MVQLNLDYNDWDDSVDVQLERPGTTLGFAIIQGSLDIGKAQSPGQSAAAPDLGPSIDAVIQLIAGGIEWCREYGLTAAQVENKFRSYVKKDRTGVRHTLALNAYREIHEIVDVKNEQRKQQDPAKIFVS